MKKTLFGVLAFVLVLATVLTATVFAADGDSNTANVGMVKKLSKTADPIVVDGKMDEAYKDAVPLLINSRSAANQKEGIYTYGFARFLWSEEENCIYCFVLINDLETNVTGLYPWESDSVELFLGMNGVNTQNWGIQGLKGDGTLSRGLQYRVDGLTGLATCYLAEEACTYTYDEDKGAFVSGGASSLLINDKTNIFGWKYNSDPTKTGWGFDRHLDGVGYGVEFRIEADGQGIDLKAGNQILFDFQVNDRYQVNPDTGLGQQTVFYYNSSYRDVQGAGTGNSMLYYDYFTLSDETVDNDASKTMTEEDLKKYGKGDANYEYKASEKETSRTFTSKFTINRVEATRSTNGTGTTAGGNGTTAGGNNGTGAAAGGNGTTTAADSSSGGCGSSIAVGTSLAMIALVGATGFFAFRRKDEE